MHVELRYLLSFKVILLFQPPEQYPKMNYRHFIKSDGSGNALFSSLVRPFKFRNTDDLKI